MQDLFFGGRISQDVLQFVSIFICLCYQREKGIIVCFGTACVLPIPHLIDTQDEGGNLSIRIRRKDYGPDVQY